MRKAYQAELDRFTDELADLTGCAETAIAQATTALVEDDEMDQLQESLHRQLLEPQRGVDLETAMDIVLLGRHYERFADHAVSVGKRVAFIVHGAQAEPTAH